MHALRPADSAAAAQAWTPIGPNQLVNINPYGSPNASGRVNALAADPTQPNVIYLGGDEGGIWKTVDAGVTWTPLTDNQPALDIRALAIAPGNGSFLYASTGADFYSDIGILSSSDAGANWVFLPFPAEPASPPPNLIIHSLAVSPSNPMTVFAAVEDGNTAAKSGIYRSDDGAATWKQVFSNNLAADTVFFDKANGSTLFGTFVSTGKTTAAAGVYKSVDYGQTWKIANGSGQLAASVTGNVLNTILLVQAPSNPLILYSFLISGIGYSSVVGVYKSTDGAQTWTAVSNNIPSGYCGNNTCAGLVAVAVHPLNPNIVYAGGTWIARSMDGGASWQNVNQGPNSVISHCDHHAFVFAGDNVTLYAGNDGGVWSSTNPDAAAPNWRAMNQTLGLTEFYPGISLNPADPSVVLGGTQDQSFILRANQIWTAVSTGDFTSTLIDPSNPAVAYAIGTGAGDGAIVRTSDSFRSFDQLRFEPNSSDPRFPWVAPMALDPANSAHIYIGTYKVYQSLNSGNTWNIISPDLTTGGTGQITAIEVAPADGNTVYVAATTATSGSKLYVNNSATSGGGAWQERDTGLAPRQINRILTNPVDAKEVFVAIGGYTTYNPGHVFHSLDGGLTWADISGNLPDIPANDIALDPDLPGVLYLATDLGVLTSAGYSGDWQVLGSALPNASVTSIRLHRGARTLRVATYGRGMWDLPLPLPSGQSLTQTIAFGPLAGIGFGAPPVALYAAASSGLPVIFASASPTACTVSGNLVTFIGSGSCSITASQPGNSSYSAATPVTRSFVNNPACSGTRDICLVTSTPQSGAGTTGQLSVTVGDANGFSDVNTVYVDFGQAPGCTLTATPNGILNLQTDDGSGWLGGISAGSSKTLANSQCALSAAGTSVRFAGNLLQVTLQLSFTAAFNGTHPVSVLVLGNAQGFSDRFAAGAWTVSSAPAIAPGGIGPIYSAATSIQAGGWATIYGSNLALSPATWSGNFPTSLGETSVLVNGKPAWLWYVSPTQINFQAPDDSTLGPVPVAVSNPNGAVKSTVTLATASPSFSLLGDGIHVAGEIATPQGNGAYGNGSYDLVGPVGAFPFSTRPVKPGETLTLFGVGFGPTTPMVLAGQLFAGAAPTQSPVTVTMGGVPAPVSFSGIIAAGLYQINLTVPAVAAGEQAIQASLNSYSTVAGAIVTVGK
jgi:uncharacterized protein (TIGR03437 family)